MLVFKCLSMCFIVNIRFGFFLYAVILFAVKCKKKKSISFPLSHKSPLLIKLMCTYSKFTGKLSITASWRRWRGGGRKEEKKAPILWKSPSPQRKRGGEKVGEGMPFLPHYTAVIYSSSPVLFSGIKTGCKFDS